MSNYISPIDTDYGIGTILSNFDTNYILHVITDSLNMKFRPFDGPMPNMVDVLERQFQLILSNAPDYRDEVENTRIETYKEIINIISNYYSLQFRGDFDSMQPIDIYSIARTLYDIFIAKFTEYMLDFFTHYIISNSDGIATYLKNSETTNKPKDQGIFNSKNYIDPNFALIFANINQVIYNMAAYDISFADLITYFLNKSSETILNLFVDCGDIYKNYYANHIIDQRYAPDVITNIKLRLQSYSYAAIKVQGE
jgi:hypothetical protein